MAKSRTNKPSAEEKIRIIIEGLRGDTLREANRDEVTNLQHENEEL